MKCALVLERDPVARQHIAALLGSLGYIVAPTDSPRMALNTAHAVRLDVVLTCTTFNMNDRRSFVGEVARLAPGAPVILLVGPDVQYPASHEGCSAVLVKPVTLRALRRVIEFGLDGGGALPSYRPPREERRRHSPRRVRPR